MNILALDTCTEMCSVAVLTHGEIVEQAELTGRGHSEKILSMIDAVLAQAELHLNDIDYLAFGRGPGSFTGVRVGVGVVQGIAFAKQIPVIPVSTLQAVAQQAIQQYEAKKIAVALDARMGEIYTAFYSEHDGLAQLEGAEQVCPPEKLQANDGITWFAAGTGWREYETELTRQFQSLAGIDNALLPTASAMLKIAEYKAKLGEVISAEDAMPVYLRDNVAKKKGEQ